MKRVFTLVAVMACGLFLASSLSAQSLKILCEDDAPFQFMKDGKLTGFSIEIVQEIQKRVKNTDKIEMVPWNRGYTLIQEEPNVVLFSMIRNADRNDKFKWVGPTTETKYVFYVKADSTIKITSLDDAKKLKSIGVYLNDARDVFLTKAGFTNLDRSPDNIANVKKLMAGRQDAFVSSDKSGPEELVKAGYKWADVKEAFVFNRTQIYVAMSKGTADATLKAWNDALDAMKKDGSFEAISKKYFPGAALPGPAITSF